MTVTITRLDQDASGLRLGAARSVDAKITRRLLALALVLEGRSRAEAAQSCAMGRPFFRSGLAYHPVRIAGATSGAAGFLPEHIVNVLEGLFKHQVGIAFVLTRLA
jgi:hypothetical protein